MMKSESILHANFLSQLISSKYVIKNDKHLTFWTEAWLFISFKRFWKIDHLPLIVCYPILSLATICLKVFSMHTYLLYWISKEAGILQSENFSLNFKSILPGLIVLFYSIVSKIVLLFVEIHWFMLIVPVDCCFHVYFQNLFHFVTETHFVPLIKAP